MRWVVNATSQPLYAQATNYTAETENTDMVTVSWTLAEILMDGQKGASVG